MPSYSEHPAFIWYKGLKTSTDVPLPRMDDEDASAVSNHRFLQTWQLYLSEVFCRAVDCPKVTPETSTNNLRKHYCVNHQDITLTSIGGRPSLEDDARAVAFYTSLHTEFKEQEALLKNKLLVLPRRVDGQIHLTHMQTMVREAGWHVPYEPCKDAGDKGCCRIENRQRCDHFELFDMEEEDMEEEDDDTDLSSLNPS